MSSTTSADDNVPPNPEADRIAELALALLEGKTDLASIGGITEDELEAIYSLGYEFYAAGKYDDANELFRFLCTSRHLEPRYWLAYGATAQMSGDLLMAVKAYGVGAMLEPENAQLSLRAGECFVKLGQHDGARLALEAAVQAAGGKPDQAPHAARAQMILATLPAQAAA